MKTDLTYVDAEIVGTGRNDGLEARFFGAVLTQRPVKFCLILVFPHTGTGCTHHGKDAILRDFLRLTKCGDLAGLLDGAQLSDIGIHVGNCQMGIGFLHLTGKAMGFPVRVLRCLPVQIQISSNSHIYNLELKSIPLDNITSYRQTVTNKTKQTKKLSRCR